MCECNYSLCKEQRNGNYHKWKVFDYCLYFAIRFLSNNEYGSYKLYSGLSNTKLTSVNIKSGYFPTYTSTTLYKDIAEKFMGKEQGMIIEIHESVRNRFKCCDVSWISKFPDEHEILISRSNGTYSKDNKFCIEILDDNKKVQTVLLTDNQW